MEEYIESIETHNKAGVIRKDVQECLHVYKVYIPSYRDFIMGQTLVKVHIGVS